MTEKTLHFQSPRLLSELYCSADDNLTAVERSLAVKLVARDDWIKIEGARGAVEKTETFFELLSKGRSHGMVIRRSDFHNVLKGIANGHAREMKDLFKEPLIVKVKKRSIVPKTINQKCYLKAIQDQEVVFGIGPAGTGKTYLAMAAAIDAFLNEKVKHLILTRPAVEAGEALGFLPGDLQEKIQPYLRPLYDAMYDILGRDLSQKLISSGVIEIAPLAYMRGRTLTNAFVILDEAQNTTPEQMLMFLTRIGDGCRMVITGDITQVDLPRRKSSGLKQAIKVLGGVDDIAFQYLSSSDVVRHPVVQSIIEAYERFKEICDI